MYIKVINISQTPLFPTSRCPEALPSQMFVVYLTFAQYTPTPPHSSLTPFARATAVLPCVSLVTLFELAVFKVVCANAQANLYVLAPATLTHTNSAVFWRYYKTAGIAPLEN